MATRKQVNEAVPRAAVYAAGWAMAGRYRAAAAMYIYLNPPRRALSGPLPG